MHAPGALSNHCKARSSERGSSTVVGRRQRQPELAPRNITVRRGMHPQRTDVPPAQLAGSHGAQATAELKKQTRAALGGKPLRWVPTFSARFIERRGRVVGEERGGGDPQVLQSHRHQLAHRPRSISKAEDHQRQQAQRPAAAARRHPRAGDGQPEDGACARSGAASWRPGTRRSRARVGGGRPPLPPSGSDPAHSALTLGAACFREIDLPRSETCPQIRGKWSKQANQKRLNDFSHVDF